MEKTLGLLLMIGLGLLLQRKIGSPEQLKGLKVLILSVALPATIFVALLNVELSQDLLILPLLALVINGLLLGATHLSRGLFNELGAARQRTMMMLLPSLAPGLSCFPFVAEFLGEDAVALAALADVGNKFFVLILLYFLAIHWYQRLNVATSSGEGNKLKQLLLALVGEPINIVMIVALVMLAFGLNLQSLPGAVGSVVLRLSSIMAPLILLFIGLAVKFTRSDFGLIFRLLLWRAGLALVVSAAFLALAPGLSAPMALLAVVFPLSSCSFWPFAHMSAVDVQEEGAGRTFDVGFGLSTLAVSLPFSTTLILGVFSFQSTFANPIHLLAFGSGMLAIACVPWIVARIKHLVTVSHDRRNEEPVAFPERVIETRHAGLEKVSAAAGE